MREQVPVLPVLGVDLAALDRDAALRRIGTLLDGRQPSLVAFANAHSCNVAARDREYRDVLARAALVLPDGSGVAIAGRLAGGRFPANLNGTDLTPALLDMVAERGGAVYLLGGRAGVAERAAAALRGHGARIAGTADGYRDDHSTVAAEIRASGADVLLVGMGNPRQELWLDRWLGTTGARLGVAVGAFLDFAAGEVRRAPPWMRAAGIEWVYRLLGEPRRLFARYVVGNPLFLARVLRSLAGRRTR